MKFIIFVILIISLFLLYSIRDVQAVGVQVHDQEGNLIASIGQEKEKHSFEIGYLTIPFLIVNLITFGTLLMYYKKKTPIILCRLINFISNFEISKKSAFTIMVLILGIYVLFIIDELKTEETSGDYITLKPLIENWSINKIPEDPRFVENLLRYTSLIVFHNIRIIPFIGSIVLVILTFFITSEISKKRFSGIISVLILLQSNLFLTYDSTATYNNFWTVFYLFSLYLILKKWYISPISYVLSLFSKGLVLLFLPMTLLFIYKSNIHNKKKSKLLVSYVIIFVSSMIAYIIDKRFIASFDTFIGLDKDLNSVLRFEPTLFLEGFKTVSIHLRFDVLVLFFLLPLIVMLFIKSRKGNVNTELVLILITMMLIVPSVFIVFVNDILTPYRLVPLVVFFAIGIGTLFSKKDPCNIQNLNNKSFFSSSLFLISLITISINLMFLFFPNIT